MQINVYEGQELVATGQVSEGKLEVATGSINAAAAAAIQQQVASERDNGTLMDGGHSLSWSMVD